MGKDRGTAHRTGHWHTEKPRSAMKRAAPRPAARKEGESLTPSEVRQRETSSVGYLLEVDAKKGYK